MTHEQYSRLLEHIDGHFHHLNRKADILMADAASVLAKITANNDLIASQNAALVALAEGQQDIVSEIAKLKAAGTGGDFTALDAAADNQSTLIAGTGKAIGANTAASSKSR